MAGQLFFGYHFSTLCMTKVMAWLGIRWSRKELMQTCRWIKNRHQGTMFKKRVGMAAVAATIYMIWKNRNSALWEHQIMMIDRIVNDTKYIVKNRIVQILGTKVKDSDRVWLERL